MGAVKRRPWTDVDTQNLNTFLADGLDRFVIAKKLKRPVNTVIGKLCKLGLCKPRGRLWSDDEVEKIIAMYLAGRAPTTIAREMGRNISSTRRKLVELQENGTFRKRRAAATVVVPVAQSDWMRPITKAQLMGRRA